MPFLYEREAETLKMKKTKESLPVLTAILEFGHFDLTTDVKFPLRMVCHSFSGYAIIFTVQ